MQSKSLHRYRVIWYIIYNYPLKTCRQTQICRSKQVLNLSKLVGTYVLQNMHKTEYQPQNSCYFILDLRLFYKSENVRVNV